jgi:hypothetical protein
MSLKLGTQDIAGISQNKICNAHFLLEPIWSDHIINDISFLRADTFSWQSGDVYTSAYNHLVQDIQGITAETETIGSYTVTFYRAIDGHKICLADQEQTILNIYNETGMAWYYILDTTNTQFKLPRTKFGFEGLRTNVGDKIDESLPNITGHTHGVMSNIGSTIPTAGAVYTYQQFSINAIGTGNSTFRSYGIDASRSSSTYQNGAPVQERATQMYLYFYVGDYSQTATEQTAGLNAELFNGKADVDLTNTTNQAKILMSGMGMPSSKYIDLTLGASGSAYTAPANGWVYFEARQTANGGYINITNNTSSMATQAQTSYNDNIHQIYLPVQKNDEFIIYYVNVTNGVIRFIYAQGSESEAS